MMHSSRPDRRVWTYWFALVATIGAFQAPALAVDRVARPVALTTMRDPDVRGTPSWCASRLCEAPTTGRALAVPVVGALIAPRDAATVDADGDGLPDEWEQQFGLNPHVATGEDGAAGDPDADGATNLAEYQAGTHPRGFYTRYFAEGATSSFFDTRLALLNVAPQSAHVLARFQTGDGTNIPFPLLMGPRTRATLDAKTVPGLATAEFSTVLESDQVLVADRTMTWDASGYGAHAETSVAAPATTWYLAEGATHSGFELFYLIQNPNDAVAHLHVTYLLPAGAPIEKDYTLGAQSRFNIWVDADDPRLANTDVSAVLTSDVPTIVERAMYLSSEGRPFNAGHESVGVTAPATEWFLAEGATGSYFDLFVLIANPNSSDATVAATYLLPSGQTLTKTYHVGANSRFNIWVDLEDAALADTALSTTLVANVPVIVERSMWWPNGGANWFEAHNSPGATVTGTKWALAEGAVGGAGSTETYVLIANTSATAGSALVTLLFEDGTTASGTFALASSSRFNVDVRAAFPQAVGKRFGVLVESLGSTPAQIVVERAMYSNAQGVTWAAGTNALATRLQ